MKTRTTIRQTLTALVIALSIVSCKKDKKVDPVTPPVEVKTVTITELRSLSTGASVKLPDGRKVKGIVISDVTNKNIDSKTVVLQEATDKPAVVVTFDAAQSFALNDEVELTVSNQTLAQVNGEIVLQNLPVANAKKTGTGTVAAKATTITDIVTNKAAWNGTLVSVTATELTSANGKYEGSLTIKDATGTITSTVSADASFKAAALPVSVSKITGIIRINGTEVRLDLRSQADVVSGDITKIISDDFTTWTDDAVNSGTVTTSKIAWYGSGSNFGATKFKGLAADASFTNASKTYPYLAINDGVFGSGSRGAILAIDATADFKGLKSIKVTFAGSKVVGKAQFADVPSPLLNASNDADNPIDFQTFNANTDVIKVGLYVVVNFNYYLIAESEGYKETGKFFTTTFKFPTTGAELHAANKEISVETGSRFLEEGLSFAVVNRSTGNPSGADFSVKQRPILIDKVELGF